MSRHSSLEKYTSHFIERVVCERWVGDWTKTATYWPSSSSSHSSASFSFSWAAQLGAWGPSLCWDMVLIPTSSLQLPDFCLMRVILLFYAHSIQPVDNQGYPLISSTGCTCYLHRCISYLTAWPGQRSICNTQSLSNIILKQIHLTLRKYPNIHYHSQSECTWE